MLSQLAIMAAIGLGTLLRDIISVSVACSTVSELFRLDQAYVGDSHVALVSLSKRLILAVRSYSTGT